MCVTFSWDQLTISFYETNKLLKCIVGMVGLFLQTIRFKPKSDYWNY
jgi:hypothetical protein